MKGILRTFAALFLAGLSVVAADRAPALAAQVYAKDMIVRTWKEPGGHRWIKFGNDASGDIIWRVLKVYTYAGGGEISGADAKSGDKIAVLLAENAVGAKRPFNDSNGTGKGNWVDSEIKKWLNSASFDVFSADEKSSVVTSNYKLGGSNVLSSYGKDTSDSSKIFLLSVEEAGDDTQKIKSDYFADDRDRDLDKSSTQDVWWLRSPGSPDLNLNIERAMFIGVGGGLSEKGHGLKEYNEVRPAMRVNLSSPTFPADQDVFYGVTATVKVNGVPLSGAAVALNDGRSPGVTQYTDNKGKTEFMTPAGGYSITASAPGCLTHKAQIIVTPSSLDFNVSLTPDSTALSREITFGKHDAKDIKWIVLEADQNNDRALLLSKHALFARKFHSSDNTKWETSDVRKDLNDEPGGFLKGGGFTAAEISVVKSTRLQDANTDDRVFLLSAKDALMYMPDNASRKEAGERYAWWLRTSGENKEIMLIRKDGRLAQTKASSDSIFGETIRIRPAMWVSLKYLYNGGDMTPPTPGGIFEAAEKNVTGTSLRLQWERAADNLSATKNLAYYVYQSISDDISTAAECEAGGRQALNAAGTLDMSSLAVTGLSPDTEYFFNIVVKDEAANKAAYSRIRVATTDKSALASLITNAKNTEQQGVVGTGAGQYPQSAKDALLAAIADAERVYNDPNATKQDVGKALNDLNAAVAAFGNEQIGGGNAGGGDGSGGSGGGGSGSGGSGGGSGSGGGPGGGSGGSGSGGDPGSGGNGGSGGGGNGGSGSNGGSGGGSGGPSSGGSSGSGSGSGSDGGESGSGGGAGGSSGSGGSGSGGGASIKDDLADKIKSASSKLSDAKSNGQVGNGIGQYPQSEWDALNRAVEDARAALNNPGATDIEMKEALDKLDAAVAKFENSKNIAKDVLDDRIKDAFQKAKEAESNGQVGDGSGQYPRSEWDALNSAIENARKVLGDINATELEIKEALGRLNAAVEAFENSKNARVGGGGGCDAGSAGISLMPLIVFFAWRTRRNVKYQ